ncbi:MAG: ATP-binding protein, partial [Thermoplasmata archaeon]|nr:ATP-binding protein [Thermoplasmata archaeon]
MRLLVRAPAPEPVVRRWLSFRAQGTRRDPERERRFGRELLGALRAAASLGLPLELAWESGPEATFLLGVSAAEGRTWTRAFLFPAYEIGQWVEASPPSANNGAEILYGYGTGPAGAPRVPLESDFPIADTLYRGLRALPRGSTVRAVALPLPLPTRPVPLLERPREPVTSAPEERLSLPDDAERQLRNRVEGRRQEPLWQVLLEVTNRGLEGSREVESVGRLLSGLLRFSGGGSVQLAAKRHFLSPRNAPLDLAERELAALFPNPWSPSGWKEPTAPGELRLYFGVGESGEPVYLRAARNEGRHFLVLGETGMGKSSALLRLARRASELGAVLLLDPIGETADRFLGLVEAARSPPVQFIAPDRSPRGINALGCMVRPSTVGNPESTRAVAEVVSALRDVRLSRYPETAFWGPRLEEHASAALLAASASPGATLFEGYCLLDPEAGEFEGWGAAGRRAVHAYRSWSEGRREEAEGARRLLGEVARSPVLRRMLCANQPEWSLEGLDSPRAITIVSGEAAKVGESTARYLLGVYLALLCSRLLARPHPGKVFLLLDEVQWYGHGALAELLRLGRRTNVHVFAATQSLASLPTSLQEPLRTNVADYLLFRGDPLEAREFSRWVPALSPERLMGLPRGQAVLFEGKGGEMHWVRTVTALPRMAARAEPRERTPVPEPTGPPAPRPGSPTEVTRSDSPPPVESGSISAEEWRILLQLAERTGEGNWRVQLAELRRGGGLTEERIRTVGAELRRRGILLRSGHMG